MEVANISATLAAASSLKASGPESETSHFVIHTRPQIYQIEPKLAVRTSADKPSQTSVDTGLDRSLARLHPSCKRAGHATP